ncbi:phenylacetic acid degradation protein [Actinorhabdospora filicis]|uniref:Phenylacetic acid degradation protein n=1 Tax=Actinorhabdospora filicis TaxID=1785913 RepID=A0A9W6W2C6_9ACTN|nr:1,2-phenylacetyl-CoA epoxidase subunit PaaE [Actinorhabdospora filicis]GLZ76867.1 phenylacetic acid degradation protein [Actinorhabdospora filicis]
MSEPRISLSVPAKRRPGFHRLPVAEVERLTDEAVRITFAVPPRLRAAFAFEPGQHLTVKLPVGQDDVRRSYSICSPPSLLAREGLLRIGVKGVPNGLFSAYALGELAEGHAVEVLPPLGHFTTKLDAGRARRYGAVVAGSGITPVLSLVAAALETEPESTFLVLFGNKAARTVMFADELADLKDRYPARLQIVHVLSREPGAELMSGRIDDERLPRLLAAFDASAEVEEWFLCGPFGMVTGAQKALAERGVPESAVHHELFFAEEIPRTPEQEARAEGTAEVTILLDGRESSFTMRRDERVLDAALKVRPELPFACKGGVCATCQAKVVTGEVRLARNYALTDADLAAGYVLTCQAEPVSDELVVDYDF